MRYNKGAPAFKVSVICLAGSRRCPLPETAKDLGVAKSVSGCWLRTKDRIISEHYPPVEDSNEGKGARGFSDQGFTLSYLASQTPKTHHMPLHL